MALIDLPTELLEQIILHTLPEGFEGFALSCKSILATCTPFIIHHNLLRKNFTTFRYSREGGSSPHDIWTAFDLIARIAAEPVIGRYIRHAEFKMDSTFLQKRERPDLEVDVEDVEYGGAVAGLLAEFPYVRLAGLDPEKYWAQMKAELVAPESYNYSQHAAAFLLTLLPNVEKVVLPYRWTPLDSTNALVNAIVDRAMQPRIGSNEPSLSRCGKFYGPAKKLEMIWSSDLEDLPETQATASPMYVRF
jgi:hypothetical protein